MASTAPARTAARSLASSAFGARAARHSAPPGRLLAAAALVALIGTGCSNAPAGTGSDGGEKPATAGSSGSNPAGGTDGGGGQNASAGAAPTPVGPQELQKRRELATCMRENGVEDFPDPDANGAILYYGDDPDMTSAGEKCDPQPGDRGREPGHGG
jgi:hypothetical protein